MRRTGMGAAAVVASLAMSAALLAGCSSGSSEESSSEGATTGTSADSSPSLGATGGAAAAACSAYFELDLLNSTYAGGAVADGDMTEAQARADFTKLLRTMVVTGEQAATDGSLSSKFAANASRMRKAVKGLPKGAPLASLSKKQQAAFALQSSRAQKACERAGFPLPDDNVVARTAAGI